VNEPTPASGELKPSNLCLLVFIDETGHELFADEKYPVFGMGGCAILGETCHRLLDVPWRRMKKGVFGIEGRPLHASEILRTATPEQRDELLRFFYNGLFSRFAVVIRKDSSIPLDLKPYPIIAGALCDAITRIMFPYPLDSIALIFEDSQRGNRLVQQHFGSMRWFKEPGKEEITVHRGLMDKKHLEAGLEVADFIVNTAGRHVRHAIMTGEREPNDFFNVTFRNVPQLLTHFVEIAAAERTPAKNPS
jgi:hypothetical protein